MVKTAFLVSGGGALLQHILDSNTFDEIKNCELAAVISSSPDAYALKRAEFANIPAYTVDAELFPNNRIFMDAICDKLKDLDIELVVMAGFMYNPGPRLVKMYEGRLITTYPALLPAFCDSNWMNDDIYIDQLNAGVKITGATAMFMSEEPGRGAIIMQKAIDVSPDDNAASLSQRITAECEGVLLPKAISLFCEGRLSLTDNIVKILPENEAE